jgi:hypothetical protein
LLSSDMPKPRKIKKGELKGSKFVNKSIRNLQPMEQTASSRSSRFKGLPVGRARDGGYYVFSRVTSKIYPSLNEIPKSVIKRVETFA